MILLVFFFPSDFPVQNCLSHREILPFQQIHSWKVFLLRKKKKSLCCPIACEWLNLFALFAVFKKSAIIVKVKVKAEKKTSELYLAFIHQMERYTQMNVKRSSGPKISRVEPKAKGHDGDRVSTVHKARILSRLMVRGGVSISDKLEDLTYPRIQTSQRINIRCFLHGWSTSLNYTYSSAYGCSHYVSFCCTSQFKQTFIAHHGY